MQLLYLTDEIKAQYLKDLSTAEAQIDSDIKDFIRTINTIPFICTTQCCQGHPDNGYLSVMVQENVLPWFENEVIRQMMQYCEDIIKRFEQIKEQSAIIRYIFWFKTGSAISFFKDFVSILNLKPAFC